jgi:hypothetical protein
MKLKTLTLAIAAIGAWTALVVLARNTPNNDWDHWNAAIRRADAQSGLTTMRVVKSPNADKVRATGSNLTQRITPPEPTPPPSPTPRPVKITLGWSLSWFFEWIVPDTGYSK